MVAYDNLACLGKRSVDSRDLLQNVDAVFAILDHPAHAGDLSLDFLNPDYSRVGIERASRFARMLVLKTTQANPEAPSDGRC